MDSGALRDAERVPHGGAADPDLLDFSANVNPERPSGVGRVYDAALSLSRSYPQDDYCDFRTAAAEYVGCDPASVVPTAGALAALRLALAVAVDAGESVLVPAPSFGEYAREVRIQGADPSFVPHDDLLSADPGDHAAAVVCTPNNPTGEAYPDAALREFCERCRRAGTVPIVDEAFADFTDRPTLAGAPGVVVLRSLTKMFGLPGLRAGFAVARGDLGDQLDVARPAWGVSAPAAEVGAYCMRQEGFVAETRHRVRTERDRMRAALDDRFEVHPSDAPFLLLDLGDGDVDLLLDDLRGRGIAARDARTFRGLDSHVRVAVRRPSENDRLLDALAAADA